jgi:hypothetical protein
MNETKLNLDAEVVVEHALHFCSGCLGDLPTDGTGWLECCGCSELLHYGDCAEKCLCVRKRTALHS